MRTYYKIKRYLRVAYHSWAQFLRAFRWTVKENSGKGVEIRRPAVLRLVLSVALIFPQAATSALALWTLFLGSAMLFSPPPVHADIPRIINFQGRLTDSNKNPRAGSFNML